MKRILFLPLFLILSTILFAGYSSTYPGRVKKHSYSNEKLDFSISIPSEWKMYYSPSSRNNIINNIFHTIKKQGAELLFFGHDASSKVYVRSIAQEIPLPLQKSIDTFITSLKDTSNITILKKTTYTINKRPFILWEYKTKAMGENYYFIEFITFKKNIALRFAIWADKDTYQKRKKEIFIWAQSFLTDKGKTAIGDTFHNYTFAAIEKNKKETPDVTAKVKEALLWEVTNKNATVYLFGSIHIGSSSMYPLPSVIYEKLEASDFLVLELDITNPKTKEEIVDLVHKKGQYQDGTTIKEHLSAKTYNLLAQFYKHNGFNIELVKTLRPWIHALTISQINQKLQKLDPKYGIEMHILSKKGKQPVIQLETVEDQLKLIIELMDTELYLKYSLLYKSDSREEVDTLLKYYIAGDIKGLEKTIISSVDNGSFEFLPVIEKLFFKRNISMTEKIEGFLKTDKKYFITVGAGHLVGKKGIISLLKKRGCKIRRLAK